MKPKVVFLDLDSHLLFSVYWILGMTGGGGGGAAARNTAGLRHGWVFYAGYRGLTTHYMLQVIIQKSHIKYRVVIFVRPLLI